MIFAGNFAPRGWALCNGQLMSIAQNTALFSLLGTTYGGDGRVTFGLPDLRGRAPLHFGQGPGLSNYTQGEVSGTETVTLLSTQMPAHSHVAGANTGAGDVAPSPTTVWAVPTDSQGAPIPSFTAQPVNTTLSPSAIQPSGGSQPHDNRSPYLVMNFCIALEGIFPSRN